LLTYVCDVHWNTKLYAAIWYLSCFSLNKDGHLYYVGDDIVGVFSLLDASECPPTFGSGKI